MVYLERYSSEKSAYLIQIQPDAAVGLGAVLIPCCALLAADPPCHHATSLASFSESSDFATKGKSRSFVVE